MNYRLFSQCDVMAVNMFEYLGRDVLVKNKKVDVYEKMLKTIENAPGIAVIRYHPPKRFSDGTRDILRKLPKIIMRLLITLYPRLLQIVKK